MIDPTDEESQIRERFQRPSSLPRVMAFWYAAALVAIAALTLSSHWLAGGLVGAGREDAAVVNIAGRQRMLSQRVAKNAALLAADPANASAAAELREAVDAWRLAHRRLVDGDAAAGLPATTDPAARSAMRDAGHALGRASDAAELCLELPGDRDAMAAMASAEAEFLVAMEEAVAAYEAAAAGRVATSERVLAGVAVATLAVLALEALLIFGPLVRRARTALRVKREVAEAAVGLARHREAVAEAAPQRECLEREVATLRAELADANRRLLASSDPATTELRAAA